MVAVPPQPPPPTDRIPCGWVSRLMIAGSEHLLVLVVAMLVIYAPGALMATLLGLHRTLPWILLPAVSLVGSVVILVPLLVVMLSLGLPIAWLAGGLGAVVTLLGALLVRRAVPLRRSRRWRPRPDRLDLLLVLPPLVMVPVAYVIGEVIAHDALYHAAQALKLATLDSPTFANTLQFPDGGPHPGYFVPAWHAIIGLVAWVTKAATLEVISVLPTILVPAGVATQAGLAQVLFQSRLAGLAGGAVAAWVYVVGYAKMQPITQGSQPRQVSIDLLLPLVVALIFVVARSRAGSADRNQRHIATGALVAAVSALVVLHVSYVALMGLVVAGIMVAGAMCAGRGVAPFAAPAAVVLATCIAGVALLSPTLSTLEDFLPGADPDVVAAQPDRLDQSRGAQVDGLFRGTEEAFRLDPRWTVRGGPVPVLAIMASVLALVLARFPAAWYLLGTTAALLVATLSTHVFPLAVGAMGPAQAKRLPLVLPMAPLLTLLVLLVAAGYGLSRTPAAHRWWLVACAAIGGGLFLGTGRYMEVGRPSPEVVLPVVLGILVAGTVLLATSRLRPAWRRDADWSPVLERGIAVPGAMLVGFGVLLLGTAPVAADRIAWAVDFASERPARVLDWPRVAHPVLQEALATAAPGETLMAPPVASYRMMAVAPVYVVSSDPLSTANVPANRIEERFATVQRFYAADAPDDERFRILAETGTDLVYVDHRRHGGLLEFIERNDGSFELVAGDAGSSVHRVVRSAGPLRAQEP